MEMLSPSLLTLATRLFWGYFFFLSEVYEANKRFLLITNHELIGWALYFVSTYAVIFFSNFILSRKKISYSGFLLVESLNLPLILFPLFVQSKAFSFFMGVANFSYAMTIHSIAFDRYFREIIKLEKESASLKSEPSFVRNLLSILCFGIPNRLSKNNFSSSLRRFPTFAVMFHGFVITFVGDFATFIIREWMPFHIQPKNMIWAQSLVGALWQMCGLEFAYWNIGVICELLGAPLTPDIHHKNPLLSTSLAEFWGIRWNPVIGKQLQDSIYKPMRKIGLDKSISVVACFTGSALIHAIPKAISEGSLQEFLMMFGFFFVQGFCLVLEVIIQKGIYTMLYPKKVLQSDADVQISTSKKQQFEHKEPPMNEEQNKSPSSISMDRDSFDAYMQSTRENFFIELAMMVFFISGYYLIFEVNFESPGLILAVIVLGIYIFWNIISIQSEEFDKSNKANRNIRLSRQTMITLIVLGWLWTVTCFISSLPLYVLPMMTAISEFYSQSLAVGPFIRTIQAFRYFYLD